jgi:hypothetical protein
MKCLRLSLEFSGCRGCKISQNKTNSCIAEIFHDFVDLR